MDRRDVLGRLSAGAAAGCAILAAGYAPLAQAEEPKPESLRGLPPLKITDITTILTAPNRTRLVIVKVSTSEPGLYGLGCATFTQRASVVQTAVDKYLKPFLVGRDVDQTEDIWQSSYVSSYWRNGPVLFNAMSGVDIALWDIKGKRANMPVYQLLGGKCRSGAALYAHVQGRDFKEVEDNAREAMAKGYRHIRVQVAIPGLATYGAAMRREPASAEPIGPTNPKDIWEPGPYLRTLPKLFEHLRVALGDDVRATARCARADLPQPGRRAVQGAGEIPPLLPGGPAAARGKRPLPVDPPAIERADCDGRAVQHPARVCALDRRAAD